MGEHKQHTGGERDRHGGIFGRWSSDGAGLPAFVYELDQRTDPRARWRTYGAQGDGGADADGVSRLHWHQIGNDRIVAVATDEGWVQLYSHEHGARWINEFRPEHGAFAGGVSYLLDRDAGTVWSTYYSDLPAEGTKIRRVFGCGYLRITVRRADIELDRVVFAPFGESRLLASCVQIRNLGTRPRRLRHGEHWDVRLHNLNLAPLGPQARARRDESSALVYAGYGADWRQGAGPRGALVARHPHGPLSHEIGFPVGPVPRTEPDVLCAPIGDTPVDGWAADRAGLFGEGGRTRPDALLDPPGRPLEPGGGGQDASFLLTCDLQLAPGERRVLGYGYGAVPPVDAAAEIAALGEDAAALFEDTRAAWRRALPRFEYGAREPWLTRELAWSAYYLRSGATYHHGLRAHTLSQGGAYQYLAGFNAGPRSTCQNALALVWSAPELAADAVRFTMAETTPEGEIAYSEHGTGLWEHALWCPSDNDLWLLWLVSEYVLATRDRAFLRQCVSYWPAPYTRPEPVWDHCLRALDHLLTTVGTGAHGLLRLRLGDWNDEIVASSGVPVDRVWQEGESTLNTAMAVHVLRRFAELADFSRGPDAARVARRARERAEEFAEAVRACWREGHLNRGWADRDTEIGHRDLYLEPQPWALIAGILRPEQERALVARIRERCADPLATRVFAGGAEGRPAVAGGGQWYAINSTLARGLARVDPREGWRELCENTLAHHAEIYPQLWFGVWSGPDCYLPSDDARPGETWAWEGLFSMQSWPVQILFAHSEPLNAAMWLSGVEPTAQGLRIDPALPFEDWHRDDGLLALTCAGDEVSGAIGALAADVLQVELALPGGLRGRDLEVRVEGIRTPARQEGGFVRFRLPVGPGRRTAFRVRRETR